MHYTNKYNKASSSYIRDGRAPVPVSETTSRIMSSIKAKNTKPELVLRKLLCKSGLKGYKLHWGRVPGRPDICYPSKKLAIFVNGCYWHRCPHCKPSMPKTHINFWQTKFRRNILRDRRKTGELTKLGWKVFVCWECKLKNNPIEYIEQINKLLKI